MLSRKFCTFAVVVLVLSGCGGGSDSSTETPKAIENMHFSITYVDQATGEILEIDPSQGFSLDVRFSPGDTFLYGESYSAGVVEVDQFGRMDIDFTELYQYGGFFSESLSSIALDRGLAASPEELGLAAVLIVPEEWWEAWPEGHTLSLYDVENRVGFALMFFDRRGTVSIVDDGYWADFSIAVPDFGLYAARFVPTDAGLTAELYNPGRNLQVRLGVPPDQ